MLHERSLPTGIFASYILLYLAVFITQIVLLYGVGLSTSIPDELIRIGSLSNLIGYVTAFSALYILFHKYLKVKFIDAIKNYKRTLTYVAGGIVVLVVAAQVITYIYSWIGIDAIPDNQAQLNALANSAMFDKVALVIYAVFLAPFVEEMIFRLGLITLAKNLLSFTKVNKTIVAVIAITISSLLFGLVHTIGDIEQIGNYAFLGAFLAIIYYKTDNVYTSVLAHMIYNGIAAYSMFM